MINLPEFNVILKEENEYYYRFTDDGLKYIDSNYV